MKINQTSLKLPELKIERDFITSFDSKKACIKMIKNENHTEGQSNCKNQ